MRKSYNQIKWLLVVMLVLSLLSGCADLDSSRPSRQEAIPENAVKMTPEMDVFPPILHSDKYQTPVPVGGAINTAGAEDSPFILPDGNILYFFFTPDANIPPEKQLLDSVTGCYVSTRHNGVWSPAERVVLEDDSELALDGCICVVGDEMWFGSARQGNYRGVDIWTAQYKNGKWTNWENAGELINVDYEVGELHVTADGNEMYFHSLRNGGKGNSDIWVIKKINGQWQEPQNIDIVNTPETDGWPFISADGNKLWFTRTYLGTPAIFCSTKINGQWSEPELIVSQFAGEPTLDEDGNLYFVHHYVENGKIIEADIYVAYRK
jgi:hypothetical protein